PFTYGDSVDPFSKRTDGILRRVLKEDPECLPKIMHTQSAAEYWHRSGSLVHTHPRGERDADIPDSVRIYSFGGTQHGPAADPPQRGIAENLANPGDYRPQLPAFPAALAPWAKAGPHPPPTVYPRSARAPPLHWGQKAQAFR